MDKITLNEMKFYGYHGLFPEENKLGQIFIVNAVLYTSLKEAGTTDKMEASIHYGEAFETIRKIVEGKPKNLIEAVGEAIASALLKQFPTLHACTIEVKKPAPPINGHYDSVAIEIFRERS